MTELDDELRPLAQELLAEFGKTVTYRHATSGGYVPTTGEVAVSYTSYVVKAQITSARFDLRADSLVQRGDQILTFAALGIVAPEPGDSVEFDNVVRKIIAVSVEYSGDLAALYTVQVR